jgi:hypothetical protein
MSSRRSRSGGTHDRHDFEPVIEVLAELACAYHFLEIAVRGGDHAEVEPNPLLRSEALDGVLLQKLAIGHRRPDLAQQEGDVE